MNFAVSTVGDPWRHTNRLVEVTNIGPSGRLNERKLCVHAAMNEICVKLRLTATMMGTCFAEQACRTMSGISSEPLIPVAAAHLWLRSRNDGRASHSRDLR